MLSQQRVCFDIHYKGTPQSELKIPGGNDWKFPADNEMGAMIFNMVSTAYEYKMSPSQFFELSSQDKALMMAHMNVRAKMQAASTQTTKKKLNG